MTVTDSKGDDRRARVEARVRALLRQVGAPGVTKEEGEAFAARAAELMAKYSLNEAALRAEQGRPPEAVGRLFFPVSGRGGHGRARIVALAVIAEAYGVKVATQGNDRSTRLRYLVLVGTESALAALELLLPAYLLQMEAAARESVTIFVEGSGDARAMAERASVRRDFLRSFLRGWGLRVGRRIAAARGVIAEEAEGTSAALVLASDASRVAAEYARLTAQAAPDREEGLDDFSPEGFAAGLRAGASVDIGNGRLDCGGTPADRQPLI